MRSLRSVGRAGHSGSGGTGGLPILEPARSLQEFLTSKYRGIGCSDQRNISPYKR